MKTAFLSIVTLLLVLGTSHVVAQEKAVDATEAKSETKSEERSETITKQEIIDAMGELRTHLRDGDFSQVRKLMSESAYADWAAQSVASGAMLAAIDFESFGDEQQTAMADQIGDIKSIREAFEKHGMDWKELAANKRTVVDRVKLRAEIKRKLPKKTKEHDEFVKAVREINHYGGSANRGYAPHLFWSKVGDIEAVQGDADVTLTLALSFGSAEIAGFEIGDVTARFTKVDGKLVYQGIIAGDKGWMVGGPFPKKKKTSDSTGNKKASPGKENSESSSRESSSSEKQEDKKSTRKQKNDSDFVLGHINVDVKAVDFKSKFFKNAFTIPDAFGHGNLGLRYPSPGIHDLDRNGHDELLIGSITGEFIVCESVFKSNIQTVWGQPSKFLDKDGKPIKIFNY